MKAWLLIASLIAHSVLAQADTGANPASALSVIAENPIEEPALFHYDVLRILVPEPDATIRSNAGEVIVSATHEPALQPGHRYRLLLDGQPTAEPGTSPVFPLSNIDRGSHTLSVEILDEQGRIVERTASQPFHMQRTSLSQKRRIKPCALEDYGQRPECPLSDKPAEEKNPFQRLF
ncbi:penicillin-binding protein [Pseudomonas sp. NFX15]|uniref:penicillin-binding protein n=1 Tax=Pseudomonas sp. NFX15 TaxID=2816958 RepID=UPI003B8DD744